MTVHYRYSIIPGGAVTDPRLEGRDLQVLCLLGRHTDKLGWCFRSQVKMAEELRCGRSSVQRSLGRLYDAGWLEKKLRSMTDVDANAQHPHAAHAYRVKMDRDLLPEEFEAADNEDEGCPPVGNVDVPSDGHGGAQPCVGTRCPDIHGHHKDFSEGPQEEPERDARAGDDKRVPIRRFLLKWPTAAVDDKSKIEKAWSALTEDDQESALAGIDPFLAELKKHGRKHVPAGWKYLDEQPWKLIDKPPDAAKVAAYDCWSKEWWAALLGRIACGAPTAFMLKVACEPGRRQWGVDPAPSEERIAEFKGYPSDGSEMAAWRPWFEAKGVRLPQWQQRIWVFLPAPNPPNTS